MRELTERLKSAVDSAVIETLELMTFEEAEPCSESKAAQFRTRPVICSKIEILEPFKGVLLTALSLAAAEKLAASLFNQKNLPPDLLLDFSGELSKTVVGRFLRNLLSPSSDFRFTMPVTVSGALPPLQELSAEYFYIIGDDKLLSVSLAGGGFKEF